MERRSVRRRSPGESEPLSRVRLRLGNELAVLNVSDGGLLVEGLARLLPGTHVEVHVTTRQGRVLVRSRVVRASVSDVGPSMLRYRGALAFDHAVMTGDG